MTVSRMCAACLAISLTLFSIAANAQSASAADPIPSAPSATVVNPKSAQATWTYQRPSEKTKFRNYIFDAFGPYSMLGAAFAAGIQQADNTPPEWDQGAKGYGRRFGSNFGIAATTNTARYAFAKALGEDTIYYRCECQSVFQRMEHATISTVTARRGEDGHRAISLPSIAAPYAGSITAVYGWYPERYGAKDAFRMGNYGQLGSLMQNFALEFLYGGPHTLLSKIRRRAPKP